MPSTDLVPTADEQELLDVLVTYEPERFQHRLSLIRAACASQASNALLAIALLAADDAPARMAYASLAAGCESLPDEPATLESVRALVPCTMSDAGERATGAESAAAPSSPVSEVVYAAWDDADATLEVLETLITDAPQVGTSLATVAGDVAAATVDLAMSTVLARTIEWVNSASAFLPDGGSLTDVAAVLRRDAEVRREEAARRDVELTELRELLEAVRSFEDSGKSNFADNLLRGSGFERVEDLIARVAEASGEALPETQRPIDDRVDAQEDQALAQDAPGPEDVTAPAVGPVPASEPEGQVVRESQPGPEPEPDPALEAEADFATEPRQDPGDGAVETPTRARLEASGAEADPAALSPWDDGTIASLIMQGRDALAALVAEAEGVEPEKAAALRLFTGAFQCSDATLLDGDLASLDLTPDQRDALDPDGARVFLAAVARIAMTFGFSPFGPLDDLVIRARVTDHPAEQVMGEVAMLAKTEYRHQQLSDDAFVTPDDWAALAARAEELRQQLGSPNVINYQRAARILRHLVRDENELGRGLSAVARGAKAAADEAGARPQDWAEIRSLRDELRDPGRTERMVADADRVVHTPQKHREPIKHAAQRRLRDLLDTVADTLDDALGLAARTSIPPRGAGQASTNRLMAALNAYSQTPNELVGDAALDRIVQWLLNPSPARGGADVPVRVLIENEMDPIYEIPRDADGHPIHGPTRKDLKTLIAGRNPADIIVGYARLGNDAASAAFRVRMNVTLDAAAEEVAARARVDLQSRRRQAIDDVDRTIGRLRSLNDDDRARQLLARLGKFRTEPENRRSDLALEAIRTIAAEAESRLEEIRRNLRTQLAEVGDEEARGRIEALLASDNEPLALEFISRYMTGRPLPEVPALGGDDFAEFYPRVVQLAEKATAPGTDTVRVVRRALGTGGEPATPVLERGLRAWEALGAQKRGRGSSSTDDYLSQVLRMIGLVPRPNTQPRDITKRKNAGVATWEVAATPIDRSYVPEFGTQTNGRFYVTVIWDAPSAKRVLETLEPAWSTRANVILYFGTLPVEQRRLLRRACAAQRMSPLVIDDAVVAWLTTRSEQGWRITQRVTLPFTAVNPFTPFARGEVPDEMFVGREQEQADIIDPTGPMFVYGGRQLGKSALLRKVERRWRAERTRQGDEGNDSAPLAIYLDLNAEGVAGVPDNLWPVLGRRLVDDGIATASTRWTAETTVRAISAWLSGDTGRQLLLLLDESDAFLTADSLSSHGTGEPFPALQRLKGLMQESAGRFKTVFAGLHQVQRFYGMRNHPTGHGGREILVGPLQPTDAADLLRNPLHALGYRFESDEALWRLLLVTNYQASLIQIMGEALIRHMLERYRAPEDGVRVTVTDRDVDDVFAKRDVRTSIEERFRWTIRLDNRYFVIALVIALRTLDGVPGEGFSADQIREDCEVYWPAGFDRSVLSAPEYRRYLSEMVGLGVLYESGAGVRAEYGLSNQAILGLLGTREDLEADLADCESLEVDVEANQTMNRRLLRARDGHDLRAPLSDGELAALVNPLPGTPKKQIVIGTKALGIDRVAQAVARATEDVGVALVAIRSVSEVAEELAKKGERHVIIDLASKDVDDAAIRAVISAVPAEVGTQVTVVLDSRNYEGAASILDGWGRILLRRWSESGLKCWQDTPFVGPVDRRDLREATSGWTEFVETTVAHVNDGLQKNAALQEVSQSIADLERAQTFLEAVGIDLHVARRWTEIDMPGPWGLAEIAEILGVEDAAPIVEDLVRIDAVDETAEGWSLDPLVFAATQALTRP